MTLPQTRPDLELDKFVEDSDGKTAVRTLSEIKGSVDASFYPSGLSKEGRATELMINSTTWTALPDTALTDRNALSVQNLSTDTDIKLNYDPNTSGWVGVLVKAGYERYYDITDGIVIYARTESGTAQVVVEELA